MNEVMEMNPMRRALRIWQAVRPADVWVHGLKFSGNKNAGQRPAFLFIAAGRCHPAE
jgi:hypothetical protein